MWSFERDTLYTETGKYIQSLVSRRYPRRYRSTMKRSTRSGGRESEGEKERGHKFRALLITSRESARKGLSISVPP